MNPGVFLVMPCCPQAQSWKRGSFLDPSTKMSLFIQGTYLTVAQAEHAEIQKSEGDSWY
jgi:hypothetical protein